MLLSLGTPWGCLQMANDRVHVSSNKGASGPETVCSSE